MTSVLVKGPQGVIIIAPHQRGDQDRPLGDRQRPPVDPDAPHRLLGRGLVEEVGQQEEDEHDQEGGQNGEAPAEHCEQQRPGLGRVPENVLRNPCIPIFWTYLEELSLLDVELQEVSAPSLV